MAKDERSDIFVKQERNKKHWYVLYVKSRHEKVVNEELTGDGYKTYLPLEKNLKQRKTRKTWVEEPVFKSYIFIKIKRNQLFEVVRKYKNVITYIKFEGEPAIIREKTLLKLKELLLKKISFEVEKGRLQVGNTIKLKSGTFKGWEGTITELRGKKKFVIELKSIGYLLEINLDDIIPPKK